MSTTTMLRHPIDTYSDQAQPAQPHGKLPKVIISNQSGAVKEGWFFFGSPPQPGVYVLSADFMFWARGSNPAQTLTVQRITQAWKEGTLTYRTRPNTTATGQSSTAIGATTSNQAVSMDCTAIVRTALLGTGAPWYGLKVTTNNATGFTFRSGESADPDVRPRLQIVYTNLPVAVTDLRPADGSVITTDKPVLTWRGVDLDGDDQLEFQVQTDNAADFATPTHDSGWVASADPEYDLSLV